MTVPTLLQDRLKKFSSLGLHSEYGPFINIFLVFSHHFFKLELKEFQFLVWKIENGKTCNFLFYFISTQRNR